MRCLNPVFQKVECSSFNLEAAFNHSWKVGWLPKGGNVITKCNTRWQRHGTSLIAKQQSSFLINTRAKRFRIALWSRKLGRGTEAGPHNLKFITLASAELLSSPGFMMVNRARASSRVDRADHNGRVYGGVAWRQLR